MNIPNSTIRYASSFSAIVRTYGLQPAYDWFRMENYSARLPYHNEQHMKFVVEDTFLYLEDKSNYDEVCHILLAAIFHDFRHSGGRESDVYNIRKAVAFVEKKFSRNRRQAYQSYRVYGLHRGGVSQCTLESIREGSSRRPRSALAAS